MYTHLQQHYTHTFFCNTTHTHIHTHCPELHGCSQALTYFVKREALYVDTLLRMFVEIEFLFSVSA